MLCKVTQFTLLLHMPGFLVPVLYIKVHRGHQQVVLCTSNGGGNPVPVVYTMEQQQDL